MIVKMKKATLIVFNKEKEKALGKLREVGTVHIKNIKNPQNEALYNIKDIIAECENSIYCLKQHKEKHYEKKHIPVENMLTELKRITALIKEKEGCGLRIADAEEKLLWYKPWGKFNLSDIELIKSKGIYINLYRVPIRALKDLKKKEQVFVIEKNHYAYVVHLAKNENDKLKYDNIKMPDRSYEDLFNQEEAAKLRIHEIDSAFAEYARTLDSFNAFLHDCREKYGFIEAANGMSNEGKISYLQGFCPSRKVAELKEFCEEEHLGYIIEDPRETDEVPTLIENPKWINIISPVFNFMKTVPGYAEYDISFWFLIFFSLFFAMLIGDAGYGFIFLIATFLISRKFKKAPREPFFLMYVLSFATIIWGAITGTWFGVEKIAEQPFFHMFVIDKINSFSASNQNFMIYLCFIIGIVHLSIAHLIILFKKINTMKAISHIGWILVLWGLFFTAGTFVLDKPFPGFVKYLFIAGIPIIMIFANFQKNVIKGILTSLTNIPLSIISSFGDVVSYLRLFAVGYASVILASTFNHMAAASGFNSILSGVMSAIILIFGHLLNIVLGFMAVIVHGVRLNMLEFSGQMGMEWSGREYSPFKKQKNNIKMEEAL